LWTISHIFLDNYHLFCRHLPVLVVFYTSKPASWGTSFRESFGSAAELTSLKKRKTNFVHYFCQTASVNYSITSGFWPRVRARALRAPVFLGALPRQTGRCAPPTLRSFAASYSSAKKYKI
jgi:hypothetical protein